MSARKNPAAAALPHESAPVRADAAMVRRCLEFAAVCDVRYYLNGVCITPSKSGGVLIIGADGYTMLVLHDPDGRADKETILPLSKRAHKAALGAKDTEYVCADTDGRIWFSTLFGIPTFQVVGKPIEGKFPDFTRVVPPLSECVQGLPGAFNLAYLRRVLDDTADSKYAGIRFYYRKGHENDGMMLARVKDGLAAVMPLWTEESLRNLPDDFLRTAPEASA